MVDKSNHRLGAHATIQDLVDCCQTRLFCKLTIDLHVAVLVFEQAGSVAVWERGKKA